MGTQKPKRLKRTPVKPTPYSEGLGESSRDIVPLTPSPVNNTASGKRGHGVWKVDMEQIFDFDVFTSKLPWNEVWKNAWFKRLGFWCFELEN
jgi:hypothetical protein